MIEIKCSICGDKFDDPVFVSNYPNLVCQKCEGHAVNEHGLSPHHESMDDCGDNPVFINGIKCWRRYRFGGFITMRDNYDCKDLSEFYEKHIKQH